MVSRTRFSISFIRTLPALFHYPEMEAARSFETLVSIYQNIKESGVRSLNCRYYSFPHFNTHYTGRWKTTLPSLPSSSPVSSKEFSLFLTWTWE